MTKYAIQLLLGADLAKQRMSLASQAMRRADGRGDLKALEISEQEFEVANADLGNYLSQLNDMGIADEWGGKHAQ